jgi:hypothetical protein
MLVVPSSADGREGVPLAFDRHAANLRRAALLWASATPAE